MYFKEENANAKDEAYTSISGWKFNFPYTFFLPPLSSDEVSLLFFFFLSLPLTLQVLALPLCHFLSLFLHLS